MEDGGWRMDDRGWRVEDGGWRRAPFILCGSLGLQSVVHHHMGDLSDQRIIWFSSSALK
jgi:hypothetical protein